MKRTSNEPAFTPGPWKTGNCDDRIIWAPRWRTSDDREDDVTPGEGVAIGFASEVNAGDDDCFHKTDENDAEWAANARLIAAAPDLYELAVQFEKVCEYEIRRATADRTKTRDEEGIRLKTITLIQIREALAKARGEIARSSSPQTEGAA